MKTIVRLLLIAGIISLAKGPLQTFKTQNPAAWHEAMATLQSIPSAVGQLLVNDAALIPKSPPSLDQKGAGNQGLSSATQGNSAQGSVSNPNKNLAQSNSSAQPEQNPSVTDWFNRLAKAFSSSFRPSGTAHSNSAGALDQPLSQFSSLPMNEGPFKNLEISGFTKTDTENLVIHCSELNLVSVLPKLEVLSSDAEAIDVKTAKLSKTNQEKLTAIYSQTMTLLAMNSTFYLTDQNNHLSNQISFSRLLTNGLTTSPITVKLTDAKSHQVLAIFQVQPKQHGLSSSTSIL